MSMSGCSKSKGLSNYETIKTDKIQIGEEYKEVYKDYNNQLVFIVNDKEKIESKHKASVIEAEGEMLELPNLEDIDGYDIMSNLEYFSSTWEANLEQSAQQIKWFTKHGYSIVLQANTQRYIEMYVDKEEDTKRVIITKNTLSVVDVESIYNGSIDEYISLNGLGGI